MAKQSKVEYENNPFYIGINGLKLFFGNAKSVAIYAVILSAAASLVSLILNIIDIINTLNEPIEPVAQKIVVPAIDPSAAPIIAIIVASLIFCFMVIAALLYGVLEYTGARMALGKKVTLGEAFKEVGKHLASYIWLGIIVVTKVLLWSLLFIVPGIIMAIRYSMAGTVFFAEGKRGNAAVKRSLELTKGAWFSVYAAVSQSSLWNLITFGLAAGVLQPGANAVVYRQLRDVTDAGQSKPDTHWLSWLTFFVPIVLFVLFVTLMLVIVLSIGASTGWR